MVQASTKRLVTEATLPELVQDMLSTFIVAGSNVTTSYDDANNRLTISASGGGTTDPEVVRDAIGAALVAGTGISITVNDAADTITIAISAHSHTASQISDSTVTGRALLTAADAPSALSTLGGISGVTAQNIPAGSVMHVRKSGSTWPSRPTDRSDVLVMWVGADPGPNIVTSGTSGMLDGVDVRLVTP